MMPIVETPGAMEAKGGGASGSSLGRPPFSMIIPQRFKLYGHTIRVEWDEKLMHKDDARGMARYRDNQVVLQPSTEGSPQSQSQIEQAYCHELTHFLFHMAGYDADRDDEVKVERISNLLYQALTTQEFA